MTNEEMPHILFHRPKHPSLYELVLVNDSPINYERVIVVTGGFVGDDEGVTVMTTEVMEKMGPPAHGSVRIEKDDFGQFDFVIWYDLYLFSKSGSFQTEFGNFKGQLQRGECPPEPPGMYGLEPQRMKLAWKALQETPDEVLARWERAERRCYSCENGGQKQYSGNPPTIWSLP